MTPTDSPDRCMAIPEISHGLIRDFLTIIAALSKPQGTKDALPILPHIARLIVKTITKLMMVVLRKWGWICAEIFLACLCIFLFVVWLVGSMAGATWSPVACSSLKGEDTHAPSRQWHTFTHIQSCDEPDPSYAVNVALVPTPEFIKAHSESAAGIIFSLDLTTGYPPQSRIVKVIWKDDHNLEIFAPGCKDVCYESATDPQKCRSSYCRITPSHEGINITLVRSHLDK